MLVKLLSIFGVLEAGGENAERLFLSSGYISVFLIMLPRTAQ